MISKFELVMEKVAEYDCNANIRSSDSVYDFVTGFLGLNKKDREHFVVMCIDAKGDVVGISNESIGGLSGAVVNPRDIFKAAILSNSTGVIFAHNHPSGDCTPSVEDITMTKKLEDGGKLLGIKVLDHLIIGDGVYTSLRQEGVIGY